MTTFFPSDFTSNDVTSDPLYYTQITPSSIWPTRIYQTNTNIPSKAVCSAMCTLVSVNCFLYVYIASTLTCYLGYFGTYSSGIATTEATVVVNTRITSIGKF